jgi:hypothetical protein
MDPMQLSRHVGNDPDCWQVRVLRSRASCILLHCRWKSGTSTTVATLALHTALSPPRSLVGSHSLITVKG